MTVNNTYSEILKRVCRNVSQEPVRIVCSKSRGLGLIATQGFDPGSVIFKEPWLFAIVETIWDCELQDDVCHRHSMETKVSHAVRSLNLQDKMLFEALPVRNCNHYESRHANLVAANNVKFESDGVIRLCVLPLLSMLNHSCSASACIVPSICDNDCRLVAVRPIHSNEEISICYIPTISFITSSVQSRREMLAHDSYWGFQCACAVCDRNDPMSEHRRQRISLLYDEAQEELSRFLNAVGEQSDSMHELFCCTSSPAFLGGAWCIEHSEQGCNLMAEEGLFHVECEIAFVLLAACGAYHMLERPASYSETMRWIARGLYLHSLLNGSDSPEAAPWKKCMQRLSDDRNHQTQIHMMIDG